LNLLKLSYQFNFAFRRFFATLCLGLVGLLCVFAIPNPHYGYGGYRGYGGMRPQQPYYPRQPYYPQQPYYPYPPPPPTPAPVNGTAPGKYTDRYISLRINLADLWAKNNP
jgi:hypothetical protein